MYMNYRSKYKYFNGKVHRSLGEKKTRGLTVVVRLFARKWSKMLGHGRGLVRIFLYFYLLHLYGISVELLNNIKKFIRRNMGGKGKCVQVIENIKFECNMFEISFV